MRGAISQCGRNDLAFCCGWRAKGGARTLLSSGNEPAARAAAVAQAQQRGMPLQLPLMDLEDQGKLTAADLWSDYRAAIHAGL